MFTDDSPADMVTMTIPEARRMEQAVSELSRASVEGKRLKFAMHTAVVMRVLRPQLAPFVEKEKQILTDNFALEGGQVTRDPTTGHPRTLEGRTMADYESAMREFNELRVEIKLPRSRFTVAELTAAGLSTNGAVLDALGPLFTLPEDDGTLNAADVEPAPTAGGKPKLAR